MIDTAYQKVDLCSMAVDSHGGPIRFLIDLKAFFEKVPWQHFANLSVCGHKLTEGSGLSRTTESISSLPSTAFHSICRRVQFFWLAKTM